MAERPEDIQQDGAGEGIPEDATGTDAPVEAGAPADAGAEAPAEDATGTDAPVEAGAPADAGAAAAADADAAPVVLTTGPELGGDDDPPAVHATVASESPMDDTADIDDTSDIDDAAETADTDDTADVAPVAEGADVEETGAGEAAAPARAGAAQGEARSDDERAARRAAERASKAAERRRFRARAKTRRAEQRAQAPAAEPDRALETGSGKPKVRQGVVLSAKPDKTISVRIDVAHRHPRYHKIMRTSSTLHVHDERNDANEGDTVRVVETRPMSRLKRWRLVEILERAR